MECTLQVKHKFSVTPLVGVVTARPTFVNKLALAAGCMDNTSMRGHQVPWRHLSVKAACLACLHAGARSARCTAHSGRAARRGRGDQWEEQRARPRWGLCMSSSYASGPESLAGRQRRLRPSAPAGQRPSVSARSMAPRLSGLWCPGSVCSARGAPHHRGRSRPARARVAPAAAPGRTQGGVAPASRQGLGGSLWEAAVLAAGHEFARIISCNDS